MYVSIFTVAYEMALEQIIADLDDLEERVENLNVDQKTNEDILLNVLKRVDDTEKDLRKVRGVSTRSLENLAQWCVASAGFSRNGCERRQHVVESQHGSCLPPSRMVCLSSALTVDHSRCPSDVFL